MSQHDVSISMWQGRAAALSTSASCQHGTLQGVAQEWQGVTSMP